MSLCLTPERQKRLIALLGLPDATKFEETVEEVQTLVYADVSGGKQQPPFMYNVAYCQSGEMYYGNPIWERFKGASEIEDLGCFFQWLHSREEGGISKWETYQERCSAVNVEEMDKILDALSVLLKYEDRCPQCMDLLGKMTRGVKPFYVPDSERFRNFLKERIVR